ncbi:MAG: glycosyltransferase family 2 protein [Dysgonomonas sp.]
MLNLSVIILTYNEEIDIRRCIENVQQISDEIFIVDSYSTVNTIEIAKTLGAKVYQNKWEQNHAKQFNWALANLPIKTKWVLRLDADEYLMPELAVELNEKLSSVPKDVSGIIFKRRHIFFNKWIKKGTYPVKLLRLFQFEKAICEQRLMDEHIRLLEGKSVEFEHDFVDHNLNNISWWTNKHIGYAVREATDLLNLEFGLFASERDAIYEGKIGEQASAKRAKKNSYARKPLFIRSFAYFIYRYIFKFGFTEGKEGFLWHFLQGWWYRTLVDAKIFEIKKACGNDRQNIIIYLRENYNIDCNNL